MWNGMNLVPVNVINAPNMCAGIVAWNTISPGFNPMLGTPRAILIPRRPTRTFHNRFQQTVCTCSVCIRRSQLYENYNMAGGRGRFERLYLGLQITWTPLEFYTLARTEVDSTMCNKRYMNSWLAHCFPLRTLQCIKRQRRSMQHRQMVATMTMQRQNAILAVNAGIILPFAPVPNVATSSQETYSLQSSYVNSNPIPIPIPTPATATATVPGPTQSPTITSTVQSSFILNTPASYHILPTGSSSVVFNSDWIDQHQLSME